MQKPIFIKNTLTQDTELFKQEFDSELLWYMCGPTVYDDSHIGHARNYIVNDTIRRIFQYYGYNVKLVMNITDIDDKIIIKSKEQGVDHSEISQKYEAEFTNDMKNLNVMLPTKTTRVSQYIDEIIDFIQQIIDNEMAYESNGSVYFDSQAYYAKYKTDNFKLNREGDDSQNEKFAVEKKDYRDFALWKKSDDVSWPSKWGNGRPGWHIECSAMAHSTLGEFIDIHSGGIDLRFPHHENEIKQTKAFTGKDKWVNYFIHVGHLHIEGLKMSKSLKNFITIKKILEEYTANEIRMLFLHHKYNDTMEYKKDSMEFARNTWKQFATFLSNLEVILREKQNVEKFNDKDDQILDNFYNVKKNVDEALRSDFNTSKVFEVLKEFMTDINTYINPKSEIIESVYHYYKDILTMLGFTFEQKSNDDKALDAIVEIRDKIKEYAIENKTFDLFKLSDEIRDIIVPELGIVIEDKGKNSSTWRKA